MTFHINPKTGASEHRADMSDPYAGGYRPAVKPEDIKGKSITHVWHDEASGNDSTWVINAQHMDPEAVRRYREQAIEAHKKAMNQEASTVSPWAETDVIKRPRKGIDWSLAAFLCVMGLIGLAIALGVAMVMS